jgi:hypothetical protein
MAAIGLAIFGAVEGAVTIGTAVEAAGSVAGAFEAMSAFEVISSVGGIVSGIGALTGNKDLMMIGGVAALAGGIGAFAQGKGWIASDGALADPSSNITAMKNGSAPGVAEAMNPTDMRLEQGTQASPLGMVEGEQSSVANALAQAPGGQTGGLFDADVNPTDTRLANSTQTSTVGMDTSQSGGISQLATDSNARDQLLARGDVTSQLGKAATKSRGVFDMFGDFSKWTNENKTLAMIAANFIGGAFDSKKRAETDFLNARADEIRTQMHNASDVPNMNLRLSGGVGFPTTNPVYHPPRVGLYTAKG